MLKIIENMALGYLKRQLARNQTESIVSNDIGISEINELFNRASGSVGENLSEVTYFTCMKMLSESLGKLNIDLMQDTDKGTVKIKNHELYNLMKYRPNPYMTPSTFKSLVEFNRNHYGNAFIWVRYQGARVKDMWVLENENVNVLVDDINLFKSENRLYYEYTNPKTLKKVMLSEKEVIHLKCGISKNGYLGLSVQDVLASTMKGNKASQNFLNSLNEKGLTARAVLEYVGDLDRNRKAELVKTIEEFATGEDNAGRIIPIPLGMKLTPLDLKLTDSQYFELRKYSALQIAAAFGIKPNQLNNYEKSSYSNSEMQNLSFYVDTLLFILKQYEEEFNYKLLTEEERRQGFHFKFNVSSILRADIKTQAECLSKYVNNGIYTPNEARKYLDGEEAEGGDILMVNGNYIPITEVGKQYQKGGE